MNVLKIGLVLITIAIEACRPSTADEGIRNEAKPGILFSYGRKIRSYGKKIGMIGRSGELVSGSHAAWTPSYDGFVYASSDRVKKLILVKWPPDRRIEWIFPLPIVKTDEPVEWEWSFSPDGRWLFVQRWIHPTWLHGPSPEQARAQAKVNWIGVVDLKTDKVIPFLVDGYFIGWRNGKCLIADQYKPLVEVDPESPKSSKILMKNSGIIRSLSRDGNYIITYDGSEGNVTVTLRATDSSFERVLLSDPLSRHHSYGAGGAAEGEFSMDGKWVVITSYIKENHEWVVRVELQSIDGKQICYTDTFKVEASTLFPHRFFPYLRWTPSGSTCFAYWRMPKGEQQRELVLVNFDGKEASVRIITPDKNPAFDYRFPMLWSPRGDALAWLVEERKVMILDVETKRTSILGEIPDDAARWSWSSPPTPLDRKEGDQQSR